MLHQCNAIFTPSNTKGKVCDQKSPAIFFLFLFALQQHNLAQTLMGCAKYVGFGTSDMAWNNAKAEK